MTWQVVYWLSFAGLLYIYVGYPALIGLCARVRPAGVRKQPQATPVSVVIAGHNEAHRLTAKLDSLFACARSELIAEVLIGSDGSDDDTASVIARYANDRVRLFPFAERRGKPAVLNDLIPLCRSEIVILTDARQPLDPAALVRLTAPFADEQVGVVSGELMFRASRDCPAAAGLGAYWTYEKLIRKSESRFRSVPGATGALYAIRRHLFRAVPANTLLDDVVIPMQAVEQGFRCLIEPGAIAWDDPSQTSAQEAVRKRRTIAGCAQLVVNQPRWLLPWRNPIWWEFVSHKLARLSSPLLLAILLVSNWLLVEHALYAFLFAGQIVFYGCGLLGMILPSIGRASRSVGVPLMFLALNTATVAALWDAARGRFRTTWPRTT